MIKKPTYHHTVLACYVGYITQAIVNNFAPLLFLTFQKTFSLSLSQITLFVTINFLVQLAVDFFAANFVDRIGYRPCLVAAHLCCTLGLIGLGFFPAVLPPYPGLLSAVIIYAVGGGLLEVLISPVIEACPSANQSSMSLLHSFYCWGMVAVVLLSTLLLQWLGTGHWAQIACLWAIVPFLNALAFARVPLGSVHAEGHSLSLTDLFRQKVFWILMLLMVCSGAAEQAMSQWASAFAERSLGVSKTVGDLAGPCFFALLMGLARMLHAQIAEKVHLERYIFLCAVLCAISYLLAVAPLSPMVNLLGCGLCGFSVGVFWPGVFSIATRQCRLGGTAMFGMLALAGDVGCSFGPTLVGLVSGLADEELKVGLCAALIFPLLIILGIRLLHRQIKRVPSANP